MTIGPRKDGERAGDFSGVDGVECASHLLSRHWAAAKTSSGFVPIMSVSCSDVFVYIEVAAGVGGEARYGSDKFPDQTETSVTHRAAAVAAAVRLRSAFANDSHGETQLLFGMQEVHEERHAFITVVRNEDRFQIGEAARRNADAFARLQIGHTGWIAAQALVDRFDHVVLDWQRIVVEAHQLDNAASGADGVPVVL